MKNLRISEAHLVRSDYFAVLISMLVAALVLLPLFTSAKDRSKPVSTQVNLHSINGSRAAVTLTNLSEGKYTISIESLDGNSIFYNTSIDSPESFAKVFDFSRLEDGDYTIILKTGNTKKEKHFEIVNGTVKVKNTVASVPSFDYKGTKGYMVIPNAENQIVSIKLISPDGEELYSAVEEQEVRKLFDFGKVENGKYTLLVNIDDSNYEFNYIKE
jgi:hypothetical protein